MDLHLEPALILNSPRRNHDGKIRPFESMSGIISSLKRERRTVTLAQGVFDIVHMGHIAYLKACKALDPKGILVVGVDNDETVRINKGRHRPINSVEDRVRLIAELASVDFVFGYKDAPDYDCPEDYIARYRVLSPTSVAVSAADSYIESKRWQAEQAGIKLEVVRHPYDNSTTTMLRIIGYEE